MSLAVLAPYRADTAQRQRIQARTRELWSEQGIEVVYADDGLNGPLFSYARAANRARQMTDAKVLIVYNVDALPLPAYALDSLEALLVGGTPWSVIFDGQQSFTPEQTEFILAGQDAGPPRGLKAMGREALLAIRADVWDDLRGMDERFVGWGPEDLAWHRVLKTVHPDGNDIPAYGLFQSLWHPDAPRNAFPDNDRLWKTYLAHDAATMRDFYLGRP